MVHCLKEINHTSLLHLTVCITHSSLVDYLAQVKKAKNYPTHSERVFS
jgi:hypothetical protein